jgi:hypothetical protein
MLIFLFLLTGVVLYNEEGAEPQPQLPRGEVGENWGLDCISFSYM